MSSSKRPVMMPPFCNCGKYLLACIIISGFAYGIYTAGISSFPFSFLMRSYPLGAVSIVRMLCAVLLPFLLTAVAVVLSKPIILYPLVFARAFLHCFCLFGICSSFGQAAWLVACLNLLPAAVVNASLFWFSFRHISGFTSSAFTELCVLTLLSILVCLADALLLIPVLTVL